MTKTAPLYCKNQVITATRIKTSEWYKYRNEGIIPRPVGREGNQDRWQSTIINAISEKLLVLGDEYTRKHTIDILLDDLEEIEAISFICQ